MEGLVLLSQGETTLKYLASYLFRAALNNSRCLRVENGQVAFSYQKSKTKGQRNCTVPAEAFIYEFPPVLQQTFDEFSVRSM